MLLPFQALGVAKTLLLFQQCFAHFKLAAALLCACVRLMLFESTMMHRRYNMCSTALRPLGHGAREHRAGLGRPLPHTDGRARPRAGCCWESVVGLAALSLVDGQGGQWHALIYWYGTDGQHWGPVAHAY